MLQNIVLLRLTKNVFKIVKNLKTIIALVEFLHNTFAKKKST